MKNWKTQTINYEFLHPGTIPLTVTITVTPSYTNAGGTCTGQSTLFTIIVNPLPTMNPVSDQTLYAGSTASPVAFTGTPAGTYFNWINYNPSIGLGPNGTGNIPSFTAINPENAPAVARIGVFPLYTSSGVSGLFLRNLLKQFGSLNNKLKC